MAVTGNYDGVGAAQCEGQTNVKESAGRDRTPLDALLDRRQRLSAELAKIDVAISTYQSTPGAEHLVRTLVLAGAMY